MLSRRSSLVLSGLSRRLGRTDWGMFIIVLALLLFGLVMVYSASYHFYLMGWEDVTGPTYHFTKQLQFALLGLGALLFGWAVDYHLYRRLAIPILAATMLVLAAMAFVGRWVITTETSSIVTFGSIQPVEIAKLGGLVYIAIWLESKGKRLHSFSLGTAPFIALLGMMAALIALQPDFSTTIILVATATAMFFVAGADMKHFALFLIIGGALVIVPLLLGYGMERVDSWLEGPFDDPVGRGYQVIQSLLALAYGGFSGQGLSQSTQKMYLGRFSHTDFLFSIIGEEWGFLGATLVIGLYGLWVWRGLRIARLAPDIYGRLLAVGIVAWVAFQAALSIAVATNSTPVTGTVLPLMSYGGSSLVSTLAAAGILLNISRSGHTDVEQRP